MPGKLASSLLGAFQSFSDEAAALHQGMFIRHGRAQCGENPFSLYLMACFGHDNLQQAMPMQLPDVFPVPARRVGPRQGHISDVIISSLINIARWLQGLCSWPAKPINVQPLTLRVQT